MKKLIAIALFGIATLQMKSQTPGKNWQYIESTDRMTGEKTYTAQNISSTRKEFSFPYQGGSRFYLFIIYENGENRVVLKVSKGQLIPSYTGEKTYRMKFDDEQPFHVSPSKEGSGLHDQVSLSGAYEIVPKLKTGNKLLVEVECYKTGKMMLDFNISGLKWEHEDNPK
jgi:hypothetical protein